MALDKRAEDLANLVLDYSTSIKPGNTLLIQAEQPFEEFARLIGAIAGKKGVNTAYDIFNLEDKKQLIIRCDETEFEKESKRLCSLGEQADKAILVDAESNPSYLQGVDPKKIAKHAEIVRKPFSDRVAGNGKEFKEIKYTWVAFPCKAYAKGAGMTLTEYTDLVYKATLIDWPKMREEMKKIKDVFDNAEDVHLYVPGRTDLHLSLKGRGGQLCAGTYNMPDGEVFYGPLESSANGTMHFPYTSIRDGNKVSGITLEYKYGEVVSFDAKKNKEFLESMLNLEGVKRIGELGIGCNYGIKKYMNNLLFDEKIGGTIHLAIGNSYKEPLNDGGGLNEGKIHWDLVCDLRRINKNPGGSIYVDGKLVQKNGVWTFSG